MYFLQRTFIQMDAGRENYLSDLLSNIRAIDNVAPQPTRSSMNTFYHDESYKNPAETPTASSWSDHSEEEYKRKVKLN